jgi:hypothetical protein
MSDPIITELNIISSSGPYQGSVTNAAFIESVDSHPRASVVMMLSSGDVIEGYVESISINAPMNDSLIATLELICTNGERVSIVTSYDKVLEMNGFGFSSKPKELNWKERIMRK